MPAVFFYVKIILVDTVGDNGLAVKQGEIKMKEIYLFV